MRGIWLRPVEMSESDIAFTWDIRNHNPNYFFNSMKSMKEHRAFIARSVDNKEFRLYIIVNGVTRIGTISIANDVIGNVIIDAQSRGKGFGRVAVDLALRILASEGFKAAKLSVRPDNWRAIKFYHDQGFEITNDQIEMRIQL